MSQHDGNTGVTVSLWESTRVECDHRGNIHLGAVVRLQMMDSAACDALIAAAMEAKVAMGLPPATVPVKDWVT